MISETVLVAWLCILRHNFDHDFPLNIPNGISEALVDAGWIVFPDEPDWDGKHETFITEAGYAVSDLNCADWGIEIELEVET